MAASRQEQRQQWERQFRATHGVSSGTYYSMRRNAANRGISPATFDALSTRRGYGEAKQTAQQAATDREGARYNAAVNLGLVRSDLNPDDFDPGIDYDFPDDFDWWYH